MHIHSVFISFACGAHSSAPTCQSAPYGAAGIFATPRERFFPKARKGRTCPVFAIPAILHDRRAGQPTLANRRVGAGLPAPARIGGRFAPCPGAQRLPRLRGTAGRARAAGGALAHSGDAAPGEAGVQPGRICAAIDGPAMRPRRHGGLHGGGAAAAAPAMQRCAGLDAAGGANHRVLSEAGGANCRSEDSGASDPRSDPRSTTRLKGAPAPQGAPPPHRPCRRRMSGDPLPRGRGRAAPPTRRISGYSALGAPRRRRRQCDCLPKGRAARSPPPPDRPCRRRMSGDPLPRGRGRAAYSTRRSSGYSASGAPRRRRRPCDCLPKGRSCPRAVPARRPRPPKGRARQRAAPAKGPRPPKGRARPRAVPAQRPIGPQTPRGAAGAPRHSAPCRAKRA